MFNGCLCDDIIALCVGDPAVVCQTCVFALTFKYQQQELSRSIFM